MRYHGKKTFMRVLPTKWRRTPADIDTERNYATVTLYIQERCGRERASAAAAYPAHRVRDECKHRRQRTCRDVTGAVLH